ncbi:MAG TPA: hypothetical protein VGZ22_29655 [Isosphaeraceae bacterium]|jgi:hypothetical protein|nr:hypothetical protein [Isosphaeraceae bacterium]
MRRTHWPLLVPALALAVSLLLPARPAAACPNCKEAVAAQDSIAGQEGKPASSPQNGYNYSVLFMMAMPFTLLGTGAFFVARAAKRGILPEL